MEIHLPDNVVKIEVDQEERLIVISPESQLKISNLCRRSLRQEDKKVKQDVDSHNIENNTEIGEHLQIDLSLSQVILIIY